MTKKKLKIIRNTVVVIILIVIGGLALNVYLTYRLEDYLRKRLSEEVSKATDGFYQFSFDHLSIGLFNGELSIRGIDFIPDPITYGQWKLIDSLPDTYVDVHVEEIYFKGVNLTWRKNYTNLQFELFEIKSPDVKVFGVDTRRDSLANYTITKNTDPKDLYEMISPYIQVLGVKRMNLSHANVTYTINDLTSTTVYALKDIHFEAYNFVLNENSSESGKLLYCDDFEFTAAKPQKLLSSDQLLLTTNNFRLSTIDSIIYISGVNLSPQEAFWNNRTQQIGDYPKATIRTVELKGIHFKREEMHHYLDARSFTIDSTNIEYYTVKENISKDKSQIFREESKSVDSWSLYSIISPLLHSISIQKIGVDNTKFKYSVTEDGYTDVFALDEFNFEAFNFYLDSLSEKRKKFWYVDDFILEGVNLSGTVSKKNANVNIDRLFLSTPAKHLNISNIQIKPLATNTIKDYALGHISSINIEGLDYSKGFGIKELEIDSVDLSYYKVSRSKPSIPQKEVPDSSSGAFFELMGHRADFISVGNINLKHINVAFHDVTKNNTYRLNRFNFYATDFLINEYTKKDVDHLFTYATLGFDFANFDNYLPNKEHRLQIQRGSFSSFGGKLVLKNVKLTPQKGTHNKIPNTEISLITPLIETKGFDEASFIKNGNLDVTLLRINSPQIRVVKNKESDKIENDLKAEDKSLSKIFNALGVKAVDISDVHFSYLDKTTNDSLHTDLEAFRLDSLYWDMRNKFSIDGLILKAPRIEYVKNSVNENQTNKTASTPPNPVELFEKDIKLGKLTVSDIKINIKQPDLTLNLETEQFDISGARWYKKNQARQFDLSALNIVKPRILVQKNLTNSYTAHVQKKDSDSSNLYDVLNTYADGVWVGKFNIVDAKLNYSSLLYEDKRPNQDINTTNLAIEGLVVNVAQRKFEVDDIRLNTDNLFFPVMNGFYTIGIGAIEVNKKEAELKLSNLSLHSPYPKMEFAYKHPKNKDWFDVTVGEISFAGVNYPLYFSDGILKVRDFKLKDVVLQNFKNQNIEIEHNIMPLIYEGLQKAPIKFGADNATVSNFSVIYEELPRGATQSGVISFMGMNANIGGFTNIVSSPNQYIKLDANGKLMGAGYFDAIWMIPVDSLNDHFLLSGHIHTFELKQLNKLVTPMAKAEVTSGTLKDLKFTTNASSERATVDMLFLYNDLSVKFVNNGGDSFKDKLMTSLANSVLKSNNPNKEKSKPREPHVDIERNPYHSTFNYFWQILQPPVVESVGVSVGKQNFLKKTIGFFNKIKNIFSPKKTVKKKDEEKED